MGIFIDNWRFFSGHTVPFPTIKFGVGDVARLVDWSLLSQEVLDFFSHAYLSGFIGVMMLLYHHLMQVSNIQSYDDNRK